jgi:hypothetical protein
MANEFKVKNGLIVIGDLTTSGTITINGALAATQSWVTSQGYLTSASLSGYATQSYVTSAIAALVDSAPAALDTLNELAAALGDDASFSTTITNSIASKQPQLNGTGLVRMSGTSVSYDNTTYLVSNFGNIEGDHTYGYPSSEGWYKIAEVVLTSTCQSFNLWGEYRDTGYFDNSHYRIHITARAECDFPTNNENHAINVNIYGSSTNDTYFSNNVRVVLTQSSSNYRKYELQYYRSTWDTGSWRLQTLGWTTYTTSQTAGTPTGTPRVYYVSKFSTDNIFVSNRISIGTTYAGFAANIAGTTYIIGASVWVNDGYGLTNASSPGTGFFPYSDGTLVFNSANSEKMRVASSGNVGIGTNSPGYKLEVNGGATGNNIARFTTGGAGGGTRGLTMYSDNSQVKLQVSDNAGGVGTWAFLNLNPDGGNVGIGTTTPSSLLNIVASGSGSTALTVQDNARKIKIGRDQIEVTDLSDVASTMYLQPNSNLVINGTAGNVGIGSQPSYKLDVNGTIRTQTGYILGANGLADITIDGNIGSQLRYGNQKILLNSADAYIYTNNIARVYVNNTGNVGIGTTSPTEKLHVNGDTRIVGNTYVGGIINAYQGDASIWVPNLGQAFTVKQTTGNVGIGTSSPGYKLEVNGNLASLNSSAAGLFSISGTRSIAIQSFAGDWNYIRSNNANLVFGTQDAANLYIRTNDTDRIFVNTSGKVAIGTSDTNSDKSDFTVYTGSGASLALTDDQVRMGGADVNWGVALRSYGALQTYGQALTLNTQAGNYAVNVQPNGVTSAQFYQSETYINTYTKINYNWGGGDYGTEAFTIQGTYPSITLRSTNADFKWLLHTDASGNFRWYTGSTYNNNAWTNRFTFGIDNNFYVDSGHIYAATGNSTQWNTAYSWGNHSSAGYQAAATAITTSNIGSQSVSYANSAGSAGQVTNQSGQLLRYDNRIISPSETTAGYLQFGFTSWANDNSAPYADYLHMRSYTDGSGGTDNLVMFKKSGIGMRIYQQTFASTTPYAEYVDVWTTANFTSTNVSNWNTAYSWGNHASAGYLTSYSETDTLASVTARGSSTSTAVTFNGGVNLAADTGIRKSGDNWIIGYSTSLPGIAIGSGTVTDKVSISSGGTQRVWFDTNGKVGIGTSTPAEELHVIGRGIFNGGSGNSSQDAVVYITKSTNDDWGLYVNNAGLDYGMYTRVSPSANYAFAIHNGTTWTTRITGDGRIYLNEKDTIASYDGWLRLNSSAHYTSGVYTPYALRNDGAFDNYGGIYGYNTIRARKLQTVNNYTTAALWTESYDLTTTGIAFHISGIAGKFLEMRTDGILYWENNKVWTAGNDGSGSGLDADLLDGQDSTGFLRLLSGGAEASLDTYTDNGFRSVSFAGHSQHLLSWNAGGSTGTVQQLFHYGVPNNGWRIRNKTDNSSWSDWGYVVMASSNQGLISGTIATQSWVGSQSYATTSYVTTQINNLIAGAPGVLDTLDELAAALGDDSNFATTVTNSIASKLSLSGGTMTGDVNWTQTDRGLTWNMNTDGAYIKFYNTGDGDTNSRLEYATSDNGDEYHRWVIGGTEKMTLKSAGLTINGTITATGYNNTNWDTAYSSLANYLLLAGGTMSGSINMNGNNVINIGQVNATHAIFTNDGSSRVMYLRGSGNIIQFQNAAATDKWEIVGRDGEFYVYKSDGAGSGYKWRIDGVGNHTITGNLTVTGTITESSSLKLKENIETSEGNLEKVVNLRPVTYNKIGSQTTELGLIAEEVAEVYPEFVQYDENGEPIGVHYSRLTAALIGAVKELTNQVQELNKKING